MPDFYRKLGQAVRPATAVTFAAWSATNDSFEVTVRNRRSRALPQVRLLLSAARRRRGEKSMAKAFASRPDMAEKRVTFSRLSEHGLAFTARAIPNTGIVVATTRSW